MELKIIVDKEVIKLNKVPHPFEVVSRTFIDTIFKDIEHGDEEHRQWLKEKLEIYKPKLFDILEDIYLTTK